MAAGGEMVTSGGNLANPPEASSPNWYPAPTPLSSTATTRPFWMIATPVADSNGFLLSVFSPPVLPLVPLPPAPLPSKEAPSPFPFLSFSCE
eukprot:8953118-Pyramimonas_sp.AAC.1